MATTELSRYIRKIRIYRCKTFQVCSNIISGAFAEGIGIVGNYVFDPSKRGRLFFQNYDYPWRNPELIKADTIFKSMERENPEYTSAVIAGKNYVGCPIWADIQVAPAYTSKTAKDLGIKKCM